MKLPLTEYKTLVFDCDGVVLNSNKVKSSAFYHAALPFGVNAAQDLVSYHVANGGISRYEKFAYFLKEIAPNAARNISGLGLEELLKSYALKVRSGLLSCEIAGGLLELKARTKGIPWLIVSGGDQDELREVFKERSLGDLFEGGIFGSPDDKELIIEREVQGNNIALPALFIGDSKYDYKAACSSDLDFIFISDWSEVFDWEKWCAEHRISHCNNIASINN
ncbi:HAD family hydrolase [Reinekea marina]|uniref:HAD family hydrolase n=1 Tax=Reinekea marina TaxID=1310421 RepID=A0ABV7WRR9_9GAMM|nr:HAD family hydrolase [Reinekea marina]MDN3649308.1 HAD family hydrolase [Reinekea marina]